MEHKNNNKINNKIISIILTICMIMVLLGVSSPVYAVEYTGVSIVEWIEDKIYINNPEHTNPHNPGEVSLVLESGCQFKISADAAGNLLALTANSGSTVVVNLGADVSIGDFINHGELNQSGTLGCTSLSSQDGTIINYGTINCSGEFVSPSDLSSINDSVITASKVTWNKGFSNGFTASVSAREALVFEGFSYSDSLDGTFNVTSDTVITSEDVAFNMSIDGGAAISVNERVEGKNASWINKTVNNVSSSLPEKLYYGVTYNYNSYVNSDSDGDVTISFANPVDEIGDTFSDRYSETPTTPGEYRMYADVAETSTYRDGFTDDDFSIVYLPNSDVYGGFSSYVTLDVTGEKYTFEDIGYPIYKDKVTVSAEGGKLFISDDLDGDFSDTLTITDEAYHNGILGFYKVVSDDIKNNTSPIYSLNGAISETIYFSGEAFLLDSRAPHIAASTDQDGVDVTIGTGTTTVRARELNISIEDMVGDYNTLDTVTLNGSTEGITTDGSGKKNITLKMVLPGIKTYEIIAKDLVGHTSTWTINMEYLPTATPSIPYTISGTAGKNGYYTSDITLIPAEGYTISADVNGIFTDTLSYKPEIENVYLMNAAELFTAPIAVDSYHIDKTKPVFATAEDESGNKYEIIDGMEVHAKSVTFDITDENLTAVIVNGTPFEVNDGKSLVELTPAAGNSVDFEIYAEDIAGNAKYAKVTVEYIKDIATAAVSVGDKFIGVNYEPALTTNSDGAATYYYKKDGASDDTYTTVKPDSIGKFYIQARIPATDKYTTVTAENTFEISFLPAPSPAYILTGEKDKNGNFVDEIIINAPAGYQISNGFAKTYSDSIAYTDGLDSVYLRRISDGAFTAAIAFNENFVNTATVSVSAEDTYLGVAVKPEATTNSVGAVTYYYKKADASDAAYTTSKPGAIGNYTVQARVAATKYYTAATAEAAFEVKYLPAPDEAFIISGKEGKNDYYISDVSIGAPEGYLISDKLGEGYEKAIDYSDAIKNIYLKRVSDGALTSSIEFNKTILIDKTSPAVSLQGVNQSGKTVAIKDGLNTYADTLMFSITDDNLSSVTINGEPVSINNGSAELILDSLSNTKIFNIVAEDKAGNIVSLSVTLKAEWLENMVIPMGASISLETGQEYFFGDGSIYHVNNDSTSYYGGNSFYVTKPGSYIFTEN